MSVLTLLLVVPIALIGAGAAILWNSIDDDIQRIPGVFTAIPEASRPLEEQPAGGAGEGMGTGTTFLLAGTDRRSDVPTTGSLAAAPSWLPGAQRSDAIMMVRLTADGKRAFVVSVPRDSWVEVPGYGMNKVNAAFSFGGPSLYVATMEQLTGTRIDHLAVVDWNGIESLVDVLGGVTLSFDSSTVGWGSSWTAGTHTLNGTEVLDYVGERYRLPRGDFDRVERQQAVLRALSSELIDEGVLTNPAQALGVARSVAEVVSVDDTLSLKDMALIAARHRGLQPGNVTFMTVPTTGTGSEGSQSVVYLDRGAQKSFWKAFRTDSLEQWVAKHDARTTPESVN